MPIDLRDSVRKQLLHIPNLEIIREVGTAWTNQLIDLGSGSLRIRLEIDRGAIDVYFGSSSDPLLWYYPSEVRRLIGDTPTPLAGMDMEKTVAELRSLLASRLDEIAILFGPELYPETRRRLLQFRDVKKSEERSSRKPQ